MKCINAVGFNDTDENETATPPGETKEPIVTEQNEDKVTTKETKTAEETTIPTSWETTPADSGGSPAIIDGQPLAAIAAIILVYIHGRGQTFFL